MNNSEDEVALPAQEHALSNIDCLRHVFSFLNLRDRLTVELSCKYWREISLDYAPLARTSLIVTCERDPPPTFRVSFCGYDWYVPTLIVRQRSEATTNDENINRKLIQFFQKFTASYSNAVTGLVFGGDYEPAHAMEAAFSELFTPCIASGLFRCFAADASFANLTSISLRNLSLARECCSDLTDVINTLTQQQHGRLEAFCMHNVSIDESNATMIALAKSFQRLRKVGLSGAGYVLPSAMGEAAAILEAEAEERGENATVPPGLQELFFVMRQHYMVTAKTPDAAFLSVLRSAKNIDLEMHIDRYKFAGVSTATREALRLAGGRLRMLDLRVWLPTNRRDGSSAGGGLPPLAPTPIHDLLSEFESMSGSLREFRLYGNDVLLDNGTFKALMISLTTAPNLRCVSLGKIFGTAVNDFSALGHLSQIEALYLSYVPKLTDSQLSTIVDRLFNLKRLWLKDTTQITNKSVTAVCGRLEAFEISNCYSFRAQSFFEPVLARANSIANRSNRPIEAASTIMVGSLQFLRVKMGSCDFKYLKWASRVFENCGVRVNLQSNRRLATLIFCNYDAWRDVESIRLQWYDCPNCDADMNAN